MSFEEIQTIIHRGLTLGKTREQITREILGQPGIKEIDRATAEKVIAYLDGIFYALRWAREKLLAQHAGKIDLGKTDPSIIERRFAESGLAMLQKRIG